MTHNNKPISLPFLPTEQLSDGVVLNEVDFDIDGERKAPFHMATFEVAAQTHSDVDLHDVRETWYVLSGRATLRSGDSIRDVTAGDVVYIESRQPHQLHNASAQPLKVLSLWW